MGRRQEDALLDIRAWLAFGIGAAFLLICIATFMLVAGTTQLESWAAGVIGAVVGYWANNLTQVISYYFGSSQSNQSNRETIDKMVVAQNNAAKALAEKVPPAAGRPLDVNVVNEPVSVAVTKPARTIVDALREIAEAAKMKDLGP